MKKKQVTFNTTDQVTIVGDYFQADLPIGHTILALHMMPADKSSWREFAQSATSAGYNLLAIDLRGHGQSAKQQNHQLDYQKFTDEQHQDSIKDVEASIEYLRQQGTDIQRLSVIGASFGANLALQFLQANQDLFTGVLISPGLNYRGIETGKFAKTLSSSQSVLLIAGEQDTQTQKTINQLPGLIPGKTTILTYPTKAHGTNLFKEHPKLIIRILNWLNSELTL